MKVVFEDLLTGNKKTDLVIETRDNLIDISINYNDLIAEINNNYLKHTLTKEELKDFIGALLHIQSKMRK